MAASRKNGHNSPTTFCQPCDFARYSRAKAFAVLTWASIRNRWKTRRPSIALCLNHRKLSLKDAAAHPSISERHGRRLDLREQAFPRNVGIECRCADQAERERFEVRYCWQKSTLRSVSCHISRPG